MASPTDWFQFYQTDLAGQGSTATFSGGGQVSESTTVATTVGSPTTPGRMHVGVGGGSSSPTTPPHLSPDHGRVSKPVRRRCRASKRTPTTLINTDAANFRAMVQQFTGGQTAPFSTSGLNIGGPRFSTGSDFQFHDFGSDYQMDFQQGHQFLRPQQRPQ
ncbi:hypothetical protein Nepgr_025799 [Nepenthes gracilis]|uniref:VQ domain-containing protein n=1 Tax=Nepenthes gracilis TaxID=150966 RepID=A0AAD3Y1W2_NEPGR|nr:hypothetical protein Nepgr_025799 [Nepenthes gracilis]